MSPVDLIKRYEPYILCNHSEFIWECISEEDDRVNVVGKNKIYITDYLYVKKKKFKLPIMFHVVGKKIYITKYF